jgi:hypothetical protein
MRVIEETKKSQLQNSERRGVEKIDDKFPTQTIISFESGRKALERARLEEGQRRVALMECSRLPCRLPEDWLEFVLTMILFFALLFGLYVGLVGPWQF